MFGNVQTHQDVDLDNFKHAFTNVIERWGFGVEVPHHTQVIKLEAKEKH
jgi:hypothetical protein